jgi:hypothetical protein
VTTLLAHFLLLALISYATVRWLVPGFVDRIIATALLFWTNIVGLCLLLTLIGKLSDVSWFFRGSICLGLATYMLLRRYVS